MANGHGLYTMESIMAFADTVWMVCLAFSVADDKCGFCTMAIAMAFGSGAIDNQTHPKSNDKCHRCK